MDRFQRICLVHYHEIGLKGHNRASFENLLSENIRFLLADFPVVTIRRISGRLCVFLREGTDYATAQEALRVMLGVPGVARVSCGYKCDRDIELMGQAAIDALHDAGQFTSFKVAARRNHTDFPIHSLEMNALIGEVLVNEFPDKKVIMKEPDVTVGVEVVESAAYVYALSLPGIGGLPVGSAGKVVALMSSGIDSPVAAWRMARRGARVIGVHFSGRPMVANTSEFLVDDIAHVLERTGCIAKVYVVPLGEYQHRIALAAPPSLRIVLYRRLMYRVAERIARKERAGALVTGESLGQVASQTLDNIRATDASVELPILRPLIGSDKLEIIRQAQELGTYEISSEPAADCCTLYMPRSPETHAKLADVEAAEALYDWESWIPEILDGAEVHMYREPRRG
ncbi:MAG: tRNA 4-thiouridine(8) synthase ThiI [Eggerthellaceae bacterium]|nr:tRNA 4-thiouridine(8) synthase ThiI [Eggerthellaceae bacterium]